MFWKCEDAYDAAYIQPNLNIYVKPLLNFLDSSFLIVQEKWHIAIKKLLRRNMQKHWAGSLHK